MQTNTIDQTNAILQQLLQEVKSTTALYVQEQRKKRKQLAREYAVILNDLTCSVVPQSHNAVLVRSILIYCSSGPASLQLGRRLIPLAAGLTPLTNIEMVLQADDQRLLTQPLAGPMFLELMGEEIPDGSTGWLI